MKYKAKVFPWEYTFHVNLAISQKITLYYLAKKGQIKQH